MKKKIRDNITKGISIVGAVVMIASILLPAVLYIVNL